MSSPFTFFTQVAEPLSLIDHFRSIGTIRDNDFPPSAVEWFNGFRQVSPINHVAKIAPRPLLLLHGNKDEVVDVSHAHRLYEQAREPKQIIILAGAGHRLRQNNKAVATVLAWLKACAQISG